MHQKTLETYSLQTSYGLAEQGKIYLLNLVLFDFVVNCNFILDLSI